jgi:predicted signal transduction protein with EAL and GGDEF domain
MQTLDADNRLKTQQLQRRDLEQRIWWLLGFAALVAVALVGLGVRRVRRTHASLSIANAQLLAQSECDPLTGLANRRHVQVALPALSTHGALQATVFLIDVDHFKQVNDRHGHAGGDAVLQALGSACARCCATATSWRAGAARSSWWWCARTTRCRPSAWRGGCSARSPPSRSTTTASRSP